MRANGTLLPGSALDRAVLIVDCITFMRKMPLTTLFGQLWSQEEAQDIAEYAVMLAVILVIVVGTLRLVGSASNNVFSSVASSIGQ